MRPLVHKITKNSCETNAINGVPKRKITNEVKHMHYTTSEIIVVRFLIVNKSDMNVVATRVIRK